MWKVKLANFAKRLERYKNSLNVLLQVKRGNDPLYYVNVLLKSEETSTRPFRPNKTFSFLTAMLDNSLLGKGVCFI